MVTKTGARRLAPGQGTEMGAGPVVPRWCPGGARPVVLDAGAG